MHKVILGIESSCDDTSAAVFKDGKVLSNCIANQEAHRQYGGVVPELASRQHLENIVPVVELALKKAKVKKTEIDAIAFTRGPGLIGSLMVGVSFAKALALSLDIPMMEVNHMQAHVLAHFAEAPYPEFPFLCLTVSGGHTQIVLVEDYLQMKIVGQTIDDAAGEAFDKAGKIMGLEYPAGPLIDRLAKEGSSKYPFPEPKIKDLDFSFSGLKTSFLYFLQKRVKENPEFVSENINDLAASIQDRIISILINKLMIAADQFGIKEVAIAGGVSANSLLRKQILEIGKQKDWNVYIPKMEYCTDNAAMIAVVGYYKFLEGQFSEQNIAPIARWAIN